MHNRDKSEMQSPPEPPAALLHSLEAEESKVLDARGDPSGGGPQESSEFNFK